VAPQPCSPVYDCYTGYYPTQITVSEDESVVTGIDIFGVPLLVRKDATYSLSQTPMKRMTTCSSNKIAALDYHGKIYFLLMQPFEWIFGPTNIIGIDIDCEMDDTWVVDTNRDLYKWEDNMWIIKGQGFDRVMVGNGTVWAISSGIPYIFNSSSSNWSVVAGITQIIDIAISSNAIIARNILGQLYYFIQNENRWNLLDGYWTGHDVSANNIYLTSANGATVTLSLEFAQNLSLSNPHLGNTIYGWTLLPFNLTDVSLAKDQTLCSGLDANGVAYSIDLHTNQITKLGERKLANIASCSRFAKYSYWGVDISGRAFYWSEKEWKQTNSSILKQIDCDQLKVVAVNRLGSTLSYVFDSESWQAFGPDGFGYDKVIISPGFLLGIPEASDTFWALSSGVLYYYFNSQWYRANYAMKDFQISSTGKVFVSNENQIYQFLPTSYAENWQFLPGNLTKVSLGQDLIIGVDFYGQVWTKKFFPALDSELQHIGWTELSIKEVFLSTVDVSNDNSILLGLNSGGSAFLYNAATDNFQLLGNNTFRQISACGIATEYIAAAVDYAGNLFLWNSRYWEILKTDINQVDCNEQSIWATDTQGAVLTFSHLTNQWTKLPNITYDLGMEKPLEVHFVYVKVCGNSVFALIRQDESFTSSTIAYFDGFRWNEVFFPYEDILASSYLTISTTIAITEFESYRNLTFFNRTVFPGKYNYVSASSTDIYTVDLTGKLWKFPIQVPGPIPSHSTEVQSIEIVSLDASVQCLGFMDPETCGILTKVKINSIPEQQYYSLFTIEYSVDNTCTIVNIVNNIDTRPCLDYSSIMKNSPSMLWTVIKYEGYVMLQNYNDNLCIREITLLPCVPVFKRTLFYSDAFLSLPSPKDIVLNGFTFKSNGLTGQSAYCKWIGPIENNIQSESSYEYDCLSTCNQYAKNTTSPCTAYAFDFILRKCYFYSVRVENLYLTSSPFTNCGFILNIIDSLDSVTSAESYNLFLLPDLFGMIEMTTITDVTYSTGCQITGAPYSNTTATECLESCISDPQCTSFNNIDGLCLFYSLQVDGSSVGRASRNSTQCGIVLSRNSGCGTVNNITTCFSNSRKKSLNYNSYLLESTEIYQNFPAVEGNCTFLVVQPYALFNNTVDCRRYCVNDDDCTSYTWDSTTKRCSLYQNQLGFNNFYPTEQQVCGILLARNPDCQVIDSSIVCKRTTVSLGGSLPKSLSFQNLSFNLEYSFNYVSIYCLIQGDFHYFTYSTTYYRQCLTLCDSDQSCTGFSYNIYNYRCELFNLPLQYLKIGKSANNYCGFSVLRNPDCIVGNNSYSCPSYIPAPQLLIHDSLKLEANLELYYGNCTFANAGFRTFQTFTFEHCSRYCSSDENCSSFSWKSTEECIFHNATLSVDSFSITSEQICGYKMLNHRFDYEKTPNCFIVSDTLMCDTSPTQFAPYNVTLNGLSLSSFDVAIKDNAAFFSGCRYYGIYDQLYFFTKWEECHYLCESSKDCLSFNWAPYGNCWLYQSSFEMLIPANTQDRWKCGFITSRNADHCRFDQSALNCTTPFSPTRNITIQINGTKITVEVNNSVTIFGDRNTSQSQTLLNFSANQFENVTASALTLLNSSMPSGDQPQVGPPTGIPPHKPTNTTSHPSNGDNQNNRMVYVVALTCFAIILVVLALFVIDSRKKESIIEEPRDIVLYPGLSLNSNFDYTMSGQLKFASKRAVGSPTDQSIMLQFSDINQKLERIPIDSYTWNGESIYIFTNVQGIPIFEELVVKFLFPLGTFKSAMDYKELGIMKEEDIEIVDYLSTNYFVRNNTNQPIAQKFFHLFGKKKYPVSIIPTANFPKLVINILQTSNIKSKILENAASTHPANLRLNYMDSWQGLNADSYGIDGIWDSILEEKSILIHADAENTILITDYLQRIADTTWTYFDKHLITKPFTASATKNYAPFES
ncbi:hypothetical protein HDV06_005731, partial [Boothiomyces sp. JEL0866]